MSSPAWLAEIRHVPAAVKVTIPEAIEHTDAELFAIVTDAASDALLVTRTVYVVPGGGLMGAVD